MNNKHRLVFFCQSLHRSPINAFMNASLTSNQPWSKSSRKGITKKYARRIEKCALGDWRSYRLNIIRGIIESSLAVRLRRRFPLEKRPAPLIFTRIFVRYRHLIVHRDRTECRRSISFLSMLRWDFIDGMLVVHY